MNYMWPCEDDLDLFGCGLIYWYHDVDIEYWISCNDRNAEWWWCACDEPFNWCIEMRG